MSNETDDRVDRVDCVDRAIDSVRVEFDEGIDESRAAGGEVHEEVREALDDVESGSTNYGTVPTDRTPPEGS